MHEYRFVKPWHEWQVGQRLCPNQHVSGQEFRYLMDNGFIVRADKYEPPQPVVHVSVTYSPSPEVETTAYAGPELRRPRGRPRKENGNADALKQEHEE